ncbi:MAG TPA: SDR family NAD(P)-dependent oxidoreductase [Micromonosporaceae bacterium]|nr:SDR family NAD(P)-dependent oxidoreductase [Micromonosporaceae bacterium]
MTGWLELAGRAVLVAGAGGIGRACIDGLVAEGARVLAVDSDQQALEKLHTDPAFHAAGGQIFHADLRDPQRCRDAVAAAQQTFGRLDVLIHAVGVNDRRPVLELTDADWDRVLSVNLSSAFHLGQAAGRVMCAQRGGRIVFVSSVSGALAHRLHAPYAASKGGLNQLLKVMAHEWAEAGVAVNAVAPGYLETPLTEQYLAKPGVRAGLEAMVPAGRLGTVHDIVNPALFLASSRATFVTGHVMYVDGGRTLV